MSFFFFHVNVICQGLNVLDEKIHKIQMIALFQTHASAHKETGELCEVRYQKKKRNTGIQVRS